jgi:hypothetical protein
MKADIYSLIGAIVILTLSLFLNIDSSGSVYLDSGSKITVPGSCIFKTVTDIECPFCGLTRGFVSISHLQISKAMSYNYLSGFLFVFVILQIPYRLIRLVYIKQKKRPIKISFNPKMNYLLIFLILSLWLIRIMDFI